VPATVADRNTTRRVAQLVSTVASGTSPAAFIPSGVARQYAEIHRPGRLHRRIGIELGEVVTFAPAPQQTG
jgi:hypothetical protein